MGYSRRGLIEQAYSELAMAGWVWDLAPEELRWANQRLDMMLGAWDGDGLRLGMAIANSDTPPDIDSDSGCPSWAVESVVLNLAVRLAAGKGKALTPETVRRADATMQAIRVRSAIPQPFTFPGGLPLGAGNVGPRNFSSFIPRDNVPIDGGGGVSFLESGR